MLQRVKCVVALDYECLHFNVANVIIAFYPLEIRLCRQVKYDTANGTRLYFQEQAENQLLERVKYWLQRGKRSCRRGNGFQVIIVLLASRLYNNIIGPLTPLYSPLQRPQSYYNDYCILIAFFPPLYYLVIYILGIVFRFCNLNLV